MLRKTVAILILAFTFVQLSGCSTLGLPPGQAKKITGEKNARSAAPSQNK